MKKEQIDKHYVQLKMLGAIKNKITAEQDKLNQFDKWERFHKKNIKYKVLALNTGSLDFPHTSIEYLLGDREDYFVKNNGGINHETTYTTFKLKTPNGKGIDRIQFYDDFLSKFNAIILCNNKPFFQHVSHDYYEFIYRDDNSATLKLEEVFKWIP